MSHSIQPAKHAPAEQVHGLSMHPKVRAALAKGAHHEWNAKDIAELLGVGMRTAQYMLEQGHIKSTGYQGRGTHQKKHRRALTLSVVNYLLEHAEEITAADGLPIIKTLLPLLPDAVLQGIIAASQALINRRASLPVVVKTEAVAAPATARAPLAANVLPFQEFAFVSQLPARPPGQATA